LSKGITGGFLPLGVTVATSKIYDAFVSDDKTKTFYHGHSFTANPLMCAAAVANIELVRKESFLKKINIISNEHQRFLESISKHPFVKSARSKGIILAIEIKTNEHTHYLNKISEYIYKYFLEKDILLRPLGNILYLVPPVCIKKKELHLIYKNIEGFLNNLSTSNFS
jgi:adenosylmethionine-8-amino-7-oxononanoate aminotransferase